MITGITIDRLRGIKHGEVPGLTGLSILVGPNGCGKSTVLDALLIGAGKSAARGVERAFRRSTAPHFRRWLGLADGRDGVCSINVSGVPFGVTRLTVANGRMAITLPDHLFNIPEQVIFDRDARKQELQIDAGGRPGLNIELVDWEDPHKISLDQLFSSIKRLGRAQFANDLVAEVVPGFRGLEILVEPDGESVLNIDLASGSVPVSLSGEGIDALCRTALHLANCNAGDLALIEEPEVHQHPRGLRVLAQGIVESVKRGVQVVLTTHSLELIQNLLHFAAEAAITDQVSTHMMRLRDGELSTTRFDGQESRTRIVEMEGDLR